VHFIFKNVFPITRKPKLWLSETHQEQNVLNSYQKKAVIILIHQRPKNLVILPQTSRWRMRRRTTIHCACWLNNAPVLRCSRWTGKSSLPTITS